VDDVHDPGHRFGRDFGESSSLAARGTFSSTVSRRTSASAAQYRLEPLQKRLFGGCHLTRPIVDLVSNSAFEIAELDVYYEEGSLKPMGANSLGVARTS
jgi:hypothetical protein